MGDSSDGGNPGIYTGKGPANMDCSARPKSFRAPKHTCESLRLNLAAAAEGRTWELLPKGFENAGDTYPLPTSRPELQKLISIPIPPYTKRTGAVCYLERAVKRWKEQETRRISVANRVASTEAQVAHLRNNLDQEAKVMRKEAREAVNAVKEEATRAIASLNDLFALGREGLGGIMKAHLAGELWKQEPVTTDQFMGCFRMVSQAVKGLGLPSDQREKARDAVMEEVAKSLESTRSAISGDTSEEETPH